jgi:hypothetical protein
MVLCRHSIHKLQDHHHPLPGQEMQSGQLSLATAHGRPRQKIIESVSMSYGFDGTVFLGCQYSINPPIHIFLPFMFGHNRLPRTGK